MKTEITIPSYSIVRRVFGAAEIIEDVSPSPELTEAVNRLSAYVVEHLPDADATGIRDLLPSIVSEAVRCGFAAGLERAASEISNRRSMANP